MYVRNQYGWKCSGNNPKVWPKTHFLQFAPGITNNQVRAYNTCGIKLAKIMIQPKHGTLVFKLLSSVLFDKRADNN